MWLFQAFQKLFVAVRETNKGGSKITACNKRLLAVIQATSEEDVVYLKPRSKCKERKE